MPSHPRNMPEQEHSIRVRSDELFAEDAPLAPAGSTKPFEIYLREIPARPLSAGLKALLWAIGIVVGVLLLLAIWRVAHHHSGVPASREAKARVSAAGAIRPDRADRSVGA